MLQHIKGRDHIKGRVREGEPAQVAGNAGRGVREQGRFAIEGDDTLAALLQHRGHRARAATQVERDSMTWGVSAIAGEDGAVHRAAPAEPPMLLRQLRELLHCFGLH